MEAQQSNGRRRRSYHVQQPSLRRSSLSGPPQSLGLHASTRAQERRSQRASFSFQPSNHPHDSSSASLASAQRKVRKKKRSSKSSNERGSNVSSASIPSRKSSSSLSAKTTTSGAQHRHSIHMPSRMTTSDSQHQRSPVKSTISSQHRHSFHVVPSRHASVIRHSPLQEQKQEEREPTQKRSSLPSSGPKRRSFSKRTTSASIASLSSKQRPGAADPVSSLPPTSSNQGASAANLEQFLSEEDLELQRSLEEQKNDLLKQLETLEQRREELMQTSSTTMESGSPPRQRKRSSRRYRGNKDPNTHNGRSVSLSVRISPTPPTDQLFDDSHLTYQKLECSLPDQSKGEEKKKRKKKKRRADSSVVSDSHPQEESCHETTTVAKTRRGSKTTRSHPRRRSRSASRVGRGSRFSGSWTEGHQ